MTHPVTVKEMIKWLEQFPEDTVVQVLYGDPFGGGRVMDMQIPSEPVELGRHVNHATFEYMPAQEAWEYVPTEEAKSRGQEARSWPYRPGVLILGVTD